jgi:hypothetical protein
MADSPCQKKFAGNASARPAEDRIEAKNARIGVNRFAKAARATASRAARDHFREHDSRFNFGW